jgi:hypothetical protein
MFFPVDNEYSSLASVFLCILENSAHALGMKEVCEYDKEPCMAVIMASS